MYTETWYAIECRFWFKSIDRLTGGSLCTLCEKLNKVGNCLGFLCLYQGDYGLYILFLVTTDEGSSPQRIEIQALGYILYLTKFMYSLVVIAARTKTVLYLKETMLPIDKHLQIVKNEMDVTHVI